jgi:predicted dithiol-disulfide oxidoreductase (DUF899 family)
MPDVKPRFPNESPKYRAARDALLATEAELRDQVERVAAQRRALPLGGRLEQDYAFNEIVGGASRTVKLSALFDPGKDTLFLYSFMYGPDAKQPCPLCTSFLDALDAQVQHIGQRISVAVVAKSPIERINEFASGRGWKRLRLVSAAGTTYQRDYFGENAEGNQWPMANVFVRKDGDVHHFWGSELLYVDTEGDSRHIDLLWPLWNVLDLTPAGRGADFYPQLSYGRDG